jgi:glucan 1,4-alpha-glucosidase
LKKTKAMRILVFITLMLITMQVHAQKWQVRSANNNILLQVELDATGHIKYSLQYRNRPVIKSSELGFKFKEPAVVLQHFQLIKIDSSVYDQEWKPVWGEYASIRDQHRELKLRVGEKKKDGIILDIVFRVFNEGLGFRYEFPTQPGMNHFVIADELSQFALTGDHMAYWIPGDYDSNEFTYNTTRLSKVDASISQTFTSIAAKRFFDKNAVQTPLMMKTADGLYINIHEASLLNYPAMNLVLNKSNWVFTSHLVPDAVGNKAYLQTPSKTPWRTIIVSDKATEVLAANRMILNLNEPTKIPETSFIRPQKFVGVWWEMHVGLGTWDYAGSQSAGTLVPHGKHSANTENVKRYIDFAARNGIDAVLVEGWNVGWEDWFGKWKEDVFDFITPYPDYDIKELTRYAKEKGVRIMMHHETSASVTNYERQLDTAFRFMLDHNMNAVKTGYVGFIIPRGEFHDGQWMVKHYERVASKAARYRIMIDAHEPVRPTGLHRQYPNWLASEAARGNEFNAWSEGNPPEHETILPFTRLMGGPMDYTPGIFETKMSVYDSSKKEMVHTTLAKQLALYVTMYSPVQMAADLPQNYEKHMDAFQFIKDVAVDWDDTRYLAAEPGDFVVVARKAKGKQEWYVGAITDENKRKLSASFDFLNKGVSYVATFYRDGKDAHWEKNPKAYTIEKFIVDHTTVVNFDLASGGGTAVSIKPASADDAKNLKKYKRSN